MREKNLKWLILLIFFAKISYAQTARQTTFENRQNCEENKGVWREFGNDCANSCHAKFDEYEVCAREITYACDCGKGKCWHDNRCVALEAYQVIFADEQEKAEKILAQKEKERREKIEKNPALKNYLENIYAQKIVATQNGGAAAGNNSSTGNTGGTENHGGGNANPPTQNVVVSAPPQAQAQQSSQQIAGGSSIATSSNSQQIKPPQGFAAPKLEDKSRIISPSQQNAGITNINAPNATNPANAQLPTELPQLPLPQ